MKKYIIGLFLTLVFMAFGPMLAKADTLLALTSGNNGGTFTIAEGQIFTVTLCNPGDGGYQFNTPQYNSSILSLTSHINVPLNPPNPPGYSGGCYGNDVFEFQALSTGTSTLAITASQGTINTENMFSATITVQSGTPSNFAPGCSANTGYSLTTGLSCGCNGTNYSTYNGQACPTTTITTTYNFGTTTLRNGSTGDAVKELQKFLNQTLDFGLVVDGKLGPKTIAVIKTWQSDHDLVSDGLIGSKTKAMMNASIQ